MTSQQSSTESLDFDIENVSTQMFEVLYVGKVTVSDSKAAPGFIDEAVSTFEENEKRKSTIKTENWPDSESSSNSTSTSSLNGSIEKPYNIKNKIVKTCSTSMEDINTNNGLNLSLCSSSSGCSLSDDNLSSIGSSAEADQRRRRFQNIWDDTVLRKSVSSSDSLDDENNVTSSKSSEAGDASRNQIVNKNRTMLIGIGKRSVTLISPDRKSVILERTFKNISFCAQGVKRAEHFGYITREVIGFDQRFLCYVFRCASEPVVEEIMLTLKHAFHSAFQQTSKNHVVCELCPMHQLHKLCQQIEGLPPEKTFELLQRRINALGERDNNEIMSRLKDEGAKNIQEQVEVMMSKLRQMCEEKQTEHTHISDSNRMASQSGEFLLVEPNRGKLTNLKKAKKSLASSLENLFRVGKNKREDVAGERVFTTESDSNIIRSLESTEFNKSPQQSPEGPVSSQLGEYYRPRSSTTGSLPELSRRLATREAAKPPSSLVASPVQDTPRKTIFSKLNSCNNNSSNASSPSTPSTPGSIDEVAACRIQGRRQSFRMGILNRVVTPAKGVKYLEEGAEEPVRESRKLSSQSCRALWRKAILETLLLIRMEKENITLQAHQDAVEIRRQKLDYEEITPCLKEVTKVWDSMLNTPGKENIEFQQKQLYNCVKAGVPRSRRGDIWLLLVEQHQLANRGKQNNNTWLSDEYSIPYENLLRQLTTHQHAILIDLGRTFPSHPYFSRQLGAGQLSLFNLLKAYSLIDTEVGYCQGLSFVAGILLMHMRESAAFTTLKYLMFHLGFRYQYRPDMSALQIKMYQLSRLLHDHYRDLYNHLERHEIAPTFYAAPWFLTLFASQFPLGFVARVFDLIFLQGTEVIYKVALVLLGNHKELIMQCNNFETIVEFLKTTLPEMGIIQMERIINQVFTLDITQQLRAYEVEYHVLQEEMSYNAAQHDASQQVSALESMNRTLKQQNLELLNQIQISNAQNQSLEIQLQNMTSRESKLKSHVRTLELERAALLNAVTKLRRLLTDDVIDFDDVPSFAQDSTATSSPLHYPAVDRILQQEGSLPTPQGGAVSASISNGSLNLTNGKTSTSSLNSLTEYDTEVAALTRSCSGSPNTTANSEADRPSSTGY